MINKEPMGPVNKAALAQGLVYVGTGVWPLVHMKSFEAVTGPKPEKWLVKTVGVLIAGIGGVLTMSAVRRQSEAEIPVLASVSAMGLSLIDVVYGGKKRISPVYLLDAVMELGFVGAQAWAWIKEQRGVDAAAEAIAEQKAGDDAWY